MGLGRCLAHVWMPLALLGVAMPLTACATVIVPPMHADDPIVAYIAHYSATDDPTYHLSLVLPVDDGYVEYSYGDWRVYALSAWNVSTVSAAALWPTQGALGRRFMPCAAGDTVQLIERMRVNTVFDRITPVTVDAGKVRALLGRLDARFERHADTARFNGLADLHMVKDDAAFCVCNTCGHETARWLEALGCDARGFIRWGDFRVERQADVARQGETACSSSR